jgi:hypothetical protein
MWIVAMWQHARLPAVHATNGYARLIAVLDAWFAPTDAAAGCSVTYASDDDGSTIIPAANVASVSVATAGPANLATPAKFAPV